MRQPLWHLRVNKRGVSGVVSGLFIMIIAVALIAFIHEVYQVQTVMSDWDADRVRERIEFSSAFFGEAEQYSPANVTPAGVGSVANLQEIDDYYVQFSSSYVDQIGTPISNMNFTYGSDGWQFEEEPGSRNVEGGYCRTIGNLNGSNYGSIYSQIQEFGTGPYWMNWTYTFSYSGKEGLPHFHWAKMILNSYDNIDAASAYAYIRVPNGTLVTINSVDLLGLTTGIWYPENIELDQRIFESSGIYCLILAVQSETDLAGDPKTPPSLVIFFDDVGFSITYDKAYTTDFYGTFSTGLDPNSIRKIELSYTGRFYDGSALINQMLYIRNFTNGNWEPLGTSIIGDRDETLGPFELSNDLTDYVHASGSLELRVYAESANAMTCEANYMMARVYFVNTSRITLEVANLGSETCDLTRLWIINSTGYTSIELVPGVNIDQTIIMPGETALLQVDYQFATTQYQFKVVTQRGTIAAYVKTAG